MVMIDTSSRWSYVSLLSTQNVVFSHLFSQIIKLSTHFYDYPIKIIRMDNVGEYIFKTFNEFCEA